MYILSRSWIILIVLLTISSSLFAQKELSEGIIHFKVTNIEGVEMDDEELQKVINNMWMKITFKKHLARIDISLDGYKMSSIENTITEIYHMLMDMGNRKIAIKMTKAEYDTKKGLQGYDYNVKYVNEKKKIAGYSCQKAILQYDNGIETYIYFTKKLAFANHKFVGEFEKINGFPLEYTQMSPMGMNLTYTAETIEKKGVDEEVFSIPTDYRVMTMQEIEEMMMGGQPGFE